MKVSWTDNLRTIGIARFPSGFYLCRWWSKNRLGTPSDSVFEVRSEDARRTFTSFYIRRPASASPLLTSLAGNDGMEGLGETAWFLSEIGCQVREQDWNTARGKKRLLEVRTAPPVRGEFLDPEQDALWLALGEPPPYLRPDVELEAWTMGCRDSWEPFD